MNAGGARAYLDPAAPDRAVQAPRAALFLDRDGVINRDSGYTHTAEATRWVPGIFDCVRRYHAAGYLVVVVTNQAGIARGLYSERAFLDYTAWVHAQFAAQGAPLAATYYCPHHPDAAGPLGLACDCRKPAPGMLLRAIEDWNIDPAASLLVGDKPWDVAAAHAAGVRDARLLQGEDLAGAFVFPAAPVGRRGVDA